MVVTNARGHDRNTKAKGNLTAKSQIHPQRGLKLSAKRQLNKRHPSKASLVASGAP